MEQQLKRDEEFKHLQGKSSQHWRDRVILSQPTDDSFWVTHKRLTRGKMFSLKQSANYFQFFFPGPHQPDGFNTGTLLCWPRSASTLLCAWLRRLAGGEEACVFSMILGVRTVWERTSHHTVTAEGQTGGGNTHHRCPAPGTCPSHADPSHFHTQTHHVHVNTGMHTDGAL